MIKTEESSMMVVACTADGGLALERRSLPRASRGELTLELTACGLCGTDLFKLATRSVPAGTVLGHELIGRVAELGPDVRDYEPGDRLVVPHHVACGICSLCRRGAETMCPTFKENLLEPGGFAQRVLVHPRAVSKAVWKVPDGVSDAAASFMEPAACVLRGILKTELPEDEGCAVVIGGGTMGLLHLLVLRAVAPGVAVVVSDPVRERRDFALELGARTVSSPDLEELRRCVDECSKGLGADAVFDTVGGSAPLASALRLGRAQAAVVLFAHAAPHEPAGFDLNEFFKAEMRLLATYSGGLQEQARIAALLGSGRLDPSPLVSHRLPFSQAAEAVALARERLAYKILLEPDP